MAGVILAHAIDVMDRPWKWGEADCCTSACDVFLRLTGIDAMAPLRGRYSTLTGAARFIRSYGGFEAMCDALAEQAGLRRVHVATPGCLAVGALPEQGFALTICVAPGTYAGKTLTGLTTIRDVTRCYRA